jgi:hypothetical protein
VFSNIKLIEMMMNDGITTIEDGPGHYGYKLQCGALEAQMQSVLVVSRGHFTRLATHIFLRCSEFLHLAYYRIWFIRLALKLGLPKRPLWRTWIRSRL